MSWNNLYLIPIILGSILFISGILLCGMRLRKTFKLRNKINPTSPNDRSSSREMVELDAASVGTSNRAYSSSSINSLSDQKSVHWTISSNEEFSSSETLRSIRESLRKGGSAAKYDRHTLRELRKDGLDVENKLAYARRLEIKAERTRSLSDENEAVYQNKKMTREELQQQVDFSTSFRRNYDLNLRKQTFKNRRSHIEVVNENN